SLEFATDHFRIHYQTVGRCAVPTADEREPVFSPGLPGPPLGWIEPGSAPSYVKRFGFWLETAWKIFREQLDLPDPSPEGPIHACLTCAEAGAASPGFLTVGCQFHVDYLCCVAIHELFHVFQYPLRAAGPWALALFEGGAVLAEDVVASGINRYLYLAS